MFCKNCGSNIKDGAVFCPKCGSSTGTGTTPAPTPAPAGSEMPLPGFSMSLEHTDAAPKGTSRGNDSKKSLRMLFIALAAVIVIAGIVALVLHLVKTKEPEPEPEPEIEYTIVGEWVSTDDCDLGDIMVDLLEENGYGDMASAIVQVLQLDESGKISLCFMEDGTLYLGVNNIYPKIGEFTYEDMGSSVMLNFSLDLSVYSVQLPPIGVSYKAKYRVDEDGLTINLFGTNLEFMPDTF